MKVLLTGSSGLVGTALMPFLTAQGHQISRLVRGTLRVSANEIRWDPGTKSLNAAEVAGFDDVVHLAGENISRGRWTAKSKRRIFDSRSQGTRRIAQHFKGVRFTAGPFFVSHPSTARRVAGRVVPQAQCRVLKALLRRDNAAPYRWLRSGCGPRGWLPCHRYGA